MTGVLLYHNYLISLHRLILYGTDVKYHCSIHYSFIAIIGRWLHVDDMTKWFHILLTVTIVFNVFFGGWAEGTTFVSCPICSFYFLSSLSYFSRRSHLSSRVLFKTDARYKQILNIDAHLLIKCKCIPSAKRRKIFSHLFIFYLFFSQLNVHCLVFVYTQITLERWKSASPSSMG